MSESQREEQLGEIIADFLKCNQQGEPLDREKLLAAHPEFADDLRSFFTNHDAMKSAAGTAFDDDATLPPDETTLHQTVGTCVRYFGDYELLDEIARGGMGVVYRARQVNLDRIVALKMILAGELASQADIKRFHQEAEAAANLEHANVVPIFEVGQNKGQHYFSMGFVDGPSLAQLVADGPLPSDESASIVWQVAEAIAYAHERGVIHRDLKPANVLLAHVPKGQREERAVTHGGQRYVPKVTDFGLAKKTEGGDQLTGTGQILGTPSYMPPEQAAGQMEASGASVDIYSLGAILYCLLTGRPPFQSASVMDTLIQVIEQEPVAPSELNPRVPRDLETICLKCLQKERRKRYDSAHELAEELGRFQRGEPIRARPVRRLERSWRWCRRNPTVASLTALVAVLLVVGVVVASVLAVRAERHAAEAEKLAGEKTALADEKIALAQRAETARADATRHLYVTRMNLAHTAWKNNNTVRVLELLEATKPKSTAGIDLRGFEWYYLSKLCHSYHRSFQATGRVNETASSPDGRYIVTAGERLELWAADTGQNVRVFTDAPGEAMAVAFSPDGSRIASGGTDKEVRLWGVEGGKLVCVLKGPREPINHLAFSPDGTQVASASGTDLGEVTTWDIGTGEVIFRHAQPGAMRDVAFVPGGEMLVTSHIKAGIELWDVSTKKHVGSWPSGGGLHIDVSPDGTRLASIGHGGLMSMFRLPDGERLWRTEAHTGDGEGIAFHPDVSRLVTCTKDLTIGIWDVATGELLHRIQGLVETPSGLALLPSRGNVVTSTESGKVKVWNLEPLQEDLGGGTPMLGINMVVDRTGKKLVIAKGANEPRQAVELWDLDTEQLRASIDTNKKPKAAISPDGSFIAVSDESVTIRDGQTLATVHEYRVEGSFGSVTYGPQGRLLAAGTGEGNVRVWDTSTHETVLDYSEDPPLGSVNELEFHPDGELLAFVGPGGLRVWNLRLEKVVHSVNLDFQWKEVAFTPDGSILALGNDVDVYLYETSTWRMLRRIRAHKQFVSEVQFSPDGGRMATCSYDQTVKLWDVATGQETLTYEAGGRENLVPALCFDATGERLFLGNRRMSVLRTKPEPQATSTLPVSWWHGHTGTVRRLDFSPDGKLAVSVCGLPQPEETIRIWDVPTGRTVHILKGHANAVTAARFLPNGRQLLTGGMDGTIRLWDVESGKEIRQFERSRSPVHDLVVFPDGKHFASAGGVGRRVGVWNLETGVLVKMSPSQDLLVRTVAITPDGKSVLFASGSRISLWNSTTEEIRHFDEDEQPILSVACSPDGRHVASASRNDAYLWNLETGKRRSLGSRLVNQVAFTPDGGWLVGARGDGSVCFWDVPKGKPFQFVTDNQEIVWSVAVSPDGKWLLSAGTSRSTKDQIHNSVIRRWRLPLRNGSHAE